MQTARRRFVIGAGSSLLLACASSNETHAEAPNDEAEKESDVTPPEDLMREHGVLNRVLLVYDEGLRRLDQNKELPADAIVSGATIIQKFVEAYHEAQEEQYVFPLFEKANLLVELVDTLKTQHDRGKELTSKILAGAREPKRNEETSGAMRLFLRMYRPHESREATVLFPALRKVTSPKQFDELADRFEEKEHQTFGPNGFEDVVAEVAKIERSLGIYDLSQFTPPKT